MIGVSGARDFPFATREMSTLFTYLNFVNFDLELLQPGWSARNDE